MEERGTPLGSAITRSEDSERERAGAGGVGTGEEKWSGAEGMGGSMGEAKLLASMVGRRAGGLHLLGVAIALAAGLRPRLRSRRDERG